MEMVWSRSATFCFLIWVVLVDVFSSMSPGNETSLHSPGSFLQGFRRWLPACGIQRNPHFRSENNSSIAVGITSNNMTRRDKQVMIASNDSITANNHDHTWSVVSSEALWHFVGLNKAAHHHARMHATATAAVDVSSNRGSNVTMSELTAASTVALAAAAVSGFGSSSVRPLCETVQQLVHSISLPVVQHTCQVMIMMMMKIMPTNSPHEVDTPPPLQPTSLALTQ